MRGLKDKVAVVTGGGQGIGRALRLRLAEEGCAVAIFDLNLEAAKETEKLAGGATVRSYELDVGDYAAVSAAVAKVESELGPIWALVNNAGWDRPAPFLSTDPLVFFRLAADHFEQRLLQGAERFGGLLERVLGDAAQDLQLHRFDVLPDGVHSLRAGPRQVDASRAPVMVVGAPFHEAGRLHAIEQAADRHLRQVEVGGERGLGHSVPSRQKRQHPPLRAGDSKRLQGAVHDDAPQPRDVVDQEAEAETGVEIFGQVVLLAHGA